MIDVMCIRVQKVLKVISMNHIIYKRNLKLAVAKEKINFFITQKIKYIPEVKQKANTT
jgi:hypothetical protein